MKIPLFLAFLLYVPVLAAQVDRSSDLYKTIRTRDSLLFDAGFNTCDIKQFEALLSEDFEFYHDEAGMTRGKRAFIDDIRNGLCKLSYKPRRELVKGSMEVFRLEKKGTLYGAIQTGRHIFYAKEKDKPEYVTSNARFTHVWLLEKGIWKLGRSLSYEHLEPKAFDSSLLFKDRRETEKWMAANRIPALGIGYIKDGKVAETSVYGTRENGEPYPVNTIFNVASLTKPVTALVALKLVDEGKMDLDEPLFKYWIDPDIKDDSMTQKLTMRHVLSHQTGFPNWRWKNAGNKLAFEFEPGTKYQYSGEGFEYLRKALEAKFAKTLDQLAQELVFTPLGMSETHYFWDQSVDESRFATWHHSDGSLYKTYKNISPNAADDLLTTVDDYCKFMLYIMNGAGLKPDLYKQMISEQVRIGPHKYWGLGWWIDESADSSGNAIIHGGDDKGVHTIVFMLPGTGEGLLIFTNCDNGVDIYIPVILHYLGNKGQKIIDIETK